MNELSHFLAVAPMPGIYTENAGFRVLVGQFGEGTTSKHSLQKRFDGWTCILIAKSGRKFIGNGATAELAYAGQSLGEACPMSDDHKQRIEKLERDLEQTNAGAVCVFMFILLMFAVTGFVAAYTCRQVNDRLDALERSTAPMPLPPDPPSP